MSVLEIDDVDLEIEVFSILFHDTHSPHTWNETVVGDFGANVFYEVLIDVSMSDWFLSLLRIRHLPIVSIHHLLFPKPEMISHFDVTSLSPE